MQYKTDNFNDVLHYWGTNLQWVTGTLGWAMIIDGNGNIVDFVLWDDTTNIQSSMVITVNGFNITPGSEWIGNGYISCASNVNQRIGNDDHNNASDWICAPQSMGISNTNLASVFNSCGIGACGSPRIPVAVTLVSGITASLGNDTLIGTPFSITLDPGPGFTSYLWSTGDTTQTIVVTTYDIYWVTVTGGPNNCSYTDSINVSLNVGLNNMIKADEFSFYPNPATDKLMITGIESFLQSAVIRITDIQGREAKDVQWKKLSSQHYEINISDLKEGIYFLQVISGNRTGVQKFVVLGR